ncbi:MAG: AglZ/HisF2 family acetamidino modification protein [Bacteroidota bacterium]
MLRVRVIPCLLLKEGGLVKTQKFKSPKYVGDPINAVRIFNEKEVDELIFLDIEASKHGTPPQLDIIKDLATECFMPFAYGGGITSLNQIQEILRIGVEKIILNTSALRNLSLVTQAAERFGSSTIIGALDVEKDWLGRHRVYNHASGKVLNLTPEDHIKQLEDAGVGEIFVNCVYKDGTYSGFDIPFLKNVSANTRVPLIVCGGASGLSDIRHVISECKVSAVAAGSIFVYQGPHRAVLISYPSHKDLIQLNDI